MKDETVEKTSAAQQRAPSEDGLRFGTTNAEIGALSRGSDRWGHVTEANQTTSTGSPRRPVSREFLEQLGVMHDAEKRLTHVLPLLRLAAHSEDLQTLLNIHLGETAEHVKALESLADATGQPLPDKSCDEIAHLLREGEIEVIKNIADPAERDAAIIAAGRQVEEFEIKSYRPLCEVAKRNDWTHERAVLASILHQEMLANDLLAGLAEGKEPLDALVKKVTLAHAVDGSI